MKKAIIIIGSLALTGGVGYMIYVRWSTPTIEGFDSVTQTATIKQKGNIIKVGAQKGVVTQMGNYRIDFNYNINNGKVNQVLVLNDKGSVIRNFNVY